MSRSHDWAEPAAESVAPGVYRVPLPLPSDGLRAVNVYVIESEDGLTCIDGGWALARSRKQFEQSLRDVGHHPRDIRSFLVTHVHRDHYTQAAAIRSEFGHAIVSLGAGDRVSLEMARHDPGRSVFTERLRRAGASEVADEWAAAPPDDNVSAECWGDPDRWLERDCVLEVGGRVLHAIQTPGHTAGHFVFADFEAGLLFAGDHVLPTITPSVGFEVGVNVMGERYPLADFLSSLAKVRALPDLRLLPAHGDASRRTHERVDELVAHHLLRLDQCVAAVAAGARTAWEVAHALPWTRRGLELRELDNFNSGLAVLETQLHLQLLAAQQRIHREAGDVDEFSDARRPREHSESASSRPD